MNSDSAADQHQGGISYIGPREAQIYAGSNILE